MSLSHLLGYRTDVISLHGVEQLAAIDPRAAVEVFSAIACDAEVGDEVRLSAAERLAALEPSV